jgi:DNA adenine methylase
MQRRNSISPGASSEMKVTAIAPWFGGKRNLAPKIIELLGPHRAYWEPFCGSCAVLLAKEPSSMETVNDLHGDLINLARVLQNEETALELYGRLNRTLMCEDLFLSAAQRCKDRGYHEPAGEPDCARAYDFFLASWLGRNGCSGILSYNWTYCVRYTSNGGQSAKRWQSAIESVPAWYRRLQNVTILNRNGFEILERIEDKPGTVIYCDPPYLEKNAKYIHDFRNEDHERLAGLLRHFQKTRVVLSYYEHPRLQELYPNWTMRKIEVAKATAHQNKLGTNKTRAVEVLLVNQGKGLF